MQRGLLLTQSGVSFVDTKSVTFNGTTSLLDVGSDASLNFERTDPFSISAWMKTASTTGGQGIFARGSLLNLGVGQQYRGYSFFYENGGELQFYLVNDYVGSNTISGHIDSAITIADNNWHHLVLTYDGSSDIAGCLVYVDGTSRMVSTYNNALSGTIQIADSARIGSWGVATAVNQGKLDEVTVWNKALSGGEVTSLYHAGKPANIAAHSAYANDISWWRMGDDGDSAGTISDRKGSNHGTGTNLVIATDAP